MVIISIRFLGASTALRSTITPLFPFLTVIICEQEGSTAKMEQEEFKQDTRIYR